MKTMPPASKSRQWKDLTVEERRERRRLRREKQREDNLVRAAKMHLARLKTKKECLDGLRELKASVHVGCSGWRYWKWRDFSWGATAGLVPTLFEDFDTVEINHLFTLGRPSPASRPGAVSPATETLFIRLKSASSSPM